MLIAYIFSSQQHPLCMQDFFQLLQPGLQMLRPPSKERSEKTVAGLAPFTAADFETLHGLRPDQAYHLTPVKISWLCLMFCIAMASACSTLNASKKLLSHGKLGRDWAKYAHA